MYLVSGRCETIEATRAAVDGLADIVADHGRSVVWVWRPHRQVAFGPRDVNNEGYPQAATAARERGYAVVERSVGGHPVAHTGSTLVFLRAVPIEDPREGLTSRYEDVMSCLEEALSTLGVDARRGEPPDAFCPGDHSLSADGKLIGLAQRVTQSVAIVSGVAIVDDADEAAAILEAVYDPLGLSFDRSSVGTIADAGGPADLSVVASYLEQALLSGATYDTRPPETFIDTNSE